MDAVPSLILKKLIICRIGMFAAILFLCYYFDALFGTTAQMIGIW